MSCDNFLVCLLFMSKPVAQAVSTWTLVTSFISILVGSMFYQFRRQASLGCVLPQIDNGQQT